MWNTNFDEQDRQNELGKFREKFIKGLNKADRILFNIASDEDLSLIHI